MTPAAAIVPDDASQLTANAWDFLQARKKDLGLPDLAIQPIGAFLKAVEQNPTTTAERQIILDQAALIFNGLYPHLPFKTDIYHFIRPQDYLDQNVRHRLAELDEAEFHDFIVAAFSLVRDAHTLYVKPTPFRGTLAFLPFQMTPYQDQDRHRHFVVTKVMESGPDGSFGHPFFGPGAEILFWGDEPIDFHVERAAARLPGGNDTARFARGTLHCTLRPLAFVQVPFADELPATTIRYRPLGTSDVCAIRLPWAVATGLGNTTGLPGGVFSVNALTAVTANYGKVLHRAPAPSSKLPSPGPDQLSKLPETFQFQHTNGAPANGLLDPANLVSQHNPKARLAYIRIKRFSDNGSQLDMSDRIVAEFQRLLAHLDEVAPDGLVLDIRSNPGGDLQAAEQMLQMLTPGPITPQRFHLANTPAVRQILDNFQAAAAREEQLSAHDRALLSDAQLELGPWLEDTGNPPLPGGDRLTTGQALTDFAAANHAGQVYQGRTILLVDGLTYSAAELFAAGFQDHSIGRIFGTDASTGGGGGNVWSHSDLLQKLGPSPGLAFTPLPRDTAMSLAFRRSSRVGFFPNQPVEDAGVTADDQFPPASTEDVISGFQNLIRRAAEAVTFFPVSRVDVLKHTTRKDGSVTVDLATQNVNSLRFFLDGQLVLTSPANAQSFVLPAVDGNSSPSRLRIKGYRENATDVQPDTLPAAVRTVLLQSPVLSAQPEIPDSVLRSPTDES